MKCDGKSYLRADYPDYAALCPRNGLKPTVVAPGAEESFSSWFKICDGDTLYVLHNNSRDVESTTDGLVWTHLVNFLPTNNSYKSEFARSNAGDIIFIPDSYLGGTAYYKPHGGSWVTTPTLPIDVGTSIEDSSVAWIRGTFLNDGTCVFLRQGGKTAASYNPTNNTWSSILLRGEDTFWGNLIPQTNIEWGVGGFLVNYTNQREAILDYDPAYGVDSYIAKGPTMGVSHEEVGLWPRYSLGEWYPLDTDAGYVLFGSWRKFGNVAIQIPQTTERYGRSIIIAHGSDFLVCPTSEMEGKLYLVDVSGEMPVYVGYMKITLPVDVEMWGAVAKLGNRLISIADIPVVAEFNSDYFFVMGLEPLAGAYPYVYTGA